MLFRLYQIIAGYSPARIIQYLDFRMRLFIVRNLPGLFTQKTVSTPKPLQWEECIKPPSFFENGTFRFLNLSKSFDGKTDWGFLGFGSLWKIQLQSLAFLLQPEMQVTDGKKLISDFGGFLSRNPGEYHPYSASLRIINCIKFISMHGLVDEEITRLIQADANKLYFSTEDYLQNNHLLENGFALLFAATFFGNQNYLRKAMRILNGELQKQILNDGAHFELSPMYHQAMLGRLLDAIALIKKNNPDEENAVLEFSSVASRMLGWMQQMYFENGDMPIINDCAEKVAPSFRSLIDYAGVLEIVPVRIPLNESGYRKIKTGRYECLVDIGGIEPQSNAGHAHSDSLHFILYVNREPFIVDTGTATYEKNALRLFQRSTPAHNTVSINNKNQSEIWGSFRVGKRVEILGVTEGPGYLEASVLHADGNTRHTRRFEYTDNQLAIHDKVSGLNPESANSFLHVDKNSQLAVANSNVNFKFAGINFRGDDLYTIEDTAVTTEFNKSETGKRINIQFRNTLITTFTFRLI